MQLRTVSPHKIYCKNKILDLSEPKVMGILNVTPDSFSDGGEYIYVDRAVQRAEQMIAEGADILDIGGESTRPNAAKVSIQEEIDRVMPVVERLKNYPIFLSIDTSQPAVIREAAHFGAHIWNDVRALRYPNAIQTAVDLDIPVVLMHMRGEPQTMNDFANYHNIIDEVRQELKQRIDLAMQAGLKKEKIILDLGFGFAKNTSHNLCLMDNIWQFQEMGFPMLAGVSRKRFIGDILQQNQAHQRIQGSVTTHLLALMQGANIVRVHDVQETVQAIKMWQAIVNNN